MGDPVPSPDWKYSNATATFYVVPTGTAGMYGSKFSVVWDKSKANVTAFSGNFWESQFSQIIDSSIGNNGRIWVNITNQNVENVTPASGKYLAEIVLTNIKPGYIPISIDGPDFRYYQNDSAPSQSVYVTTNPGKIKFYLGDFAESLTNQTVGDGKISFADLNFFSFAY
jgi:hypothetical protein